jgi:hypothetical protein
VQPATTPASHHTRSAPALHPLSIRTTSLELLQPPPSLVLPIHLILPCLSLSCLTHLILSRPILFVTRISSNPSPFTPRSSHQPRIIVVPHRQTPLPPWCSSQLSGMLPNGHAIPSNARLLHLASHFRWCKKAHRPSVPSCPPPPLE